MKKKDEFSKLIQLKNSFFSSLPSLFYTEQQPARLNNPHLVCVSEKAAELIGFTVEDFQESELIDLFTGNRLFESSIPLSAVYSGHQFGQWAGQLGDGRAILLGEIETENGSWELQLKGAGETSYSRRGDGRAVLRSSIREFLCSEAMAGLGIPTTRALCITASKDSVYRESVETAAVVTRMSPSFVRFGSFEHWYAIQDHKNLQLLADYVIDSFYSECRKSEHPYKAFLKEVIRRTAELVAQWQAMGFMHGVLNTDNMSILGLTLDYGPFGFMDAFNQGHICNHSDHQGRYSYVNQPYIGHWNCRALTQALLPLIGEVEEAQALLEEYLPIYRKKYSELFQAKLGLQQDQEGDNIVIEKLLVIMQESQVDFTLFFRKLGTLKVDDPTSDSSIRDLFIDRQAFDDWAVLYRKRLKLEESKDAERSVAMNKVNPKYILRNHLLQIAIEKAQNDDFSEVNKLLLIMEKPFDEQIEYDEYAQLPPDWAVDLEVSCSS